MVYCKLQLSFLLENLHNTVIILNGSSNTRYVTLILP